MSRYHKEQYNNFLDVKQSVRECYSRARFFKSSLEELLYMKKKMIQENPALKKLNRYYQGKISGYDLALWELLQSEWIIWKYFYTNRVGNTVIVDYDNLPHKIKESGNFKSCHFWKNSNQQFGAAVQGYGPGNNPKRKELIQRIKGLNPHKRKK